MGQFLSLVYKRDGSWSMSTVRAHSAGIRTGVSSAGVVAVVECVWYVGNCIGIFSARMASLSDWWCNV